MSQDVEKLSPYFHRSEFACKCGCGFDTVDATLLTILHGIREQSGKPLHINSACRCKEHNEAEGGSENSQHLYGRAVDFWVEDIDPDSLADALEDMFPNNFGIGRYSNRVHFDTRTKKARWDKR